MDKWIGGWMDGCMDGRTGKDLVLFCLFLENYLIYHANYFRYPRRRLQQSVLKK